LIAVIFSVAHLWWLQYSNVDKHSDIMLLLLLWCAHNRLALRCDS